jgi:formate hydrogenlyase subunit 3/multisubunit Na+/H+ antiporter MnhD subunit
MQGWAILSAFAVPLALLLVFLAQRGDDPGRGLRWLLPLASLPALALGLLPAQTLEAPALLLGVTLRVDELARPLLLLIGVAWSAAAWYAADRMEQRFRVFALYWLATLTGLQVAVLAGELATFYTGYVVMTFAAYGLVVHERSAAAMEAARVYMVMALFGEALLLTGVLFLGSKLGNVELASLPAALQGSDATWPAALLLGGLAVKMGLVPLHLWLPVAHPVAPVAASAILSGVLVKAGLLGALRLVPSAAFEAGTGPALLLAAGLFTAFYGVAVGLTQKKLKTVLAYSTVSQMGLLATSLAVTLAPGHERGAPLVALLVLHHGLNKAALFLAAGCEAGATRWRRLLLALPAASLVGLPLTSGELAKTALKGTLADSALGAATPIVLGLASVATALLMLRVGWLADAQRDARVRVHPAWPVLVFAGLALPWWQVAATTGVTLPDLGTLRDALWPAAAAAALAWAWRRARGPAPTLPAGDLLVPLQGGLMAAGRTWHRARRAVDWPPRWPVAPIAPRVAALIRHVEAALVRLPAAGVVLLTLVALLWWTLV